MKKMSSIFQTFQEDIFDIPLIHPPDGAETSISSEIKAKAPAAFFGPPFS